MDLTLRRLRRVLGWSFWSKSQEFNVKKVWVLFSLGPFPKRPLKVHIIHSKLGLFPLLHAPVTSSQSIRGWVWFLVDLGVCYVFVMNMIMFVYFKIVWKKTMYSKFFTSMCVWKNVIAIGVLVLRIRIVNILVVILRA